MVICSDCYDNANIYSRTRDYCHYSYLSEDDALDAQLSRDASREGQHEDAALHNLITRDPQEPQHHALHHYNSKGQSACTLAKSSGGGAIHGAMLQLYISVF